MSNFDVQCEAILRGLRRLEAILSQPFASKALALDESTIMSNHHSQLVRLRKSLEQYVERQGDLTYIGLIGHFSSGKSSLINSLLQVWSTTHERATGLHPTDTVITLLTHHQNASSLLAGSGGGSMPIRIQTLENSFLTNLVIADSPGTGDPHLIEEMAKDFLPMCDLVLFVFSAASPLDETDLPTLRELHKRLPFIPLLFVVTRADEIRKDKSLPLSPENFNEPKAAEFMVETLSRIARLLDSNQYGHTDFVLVDNVTQFGIPKLKEELLRRADPLNPSSRVAVHGHKVHFYFVTAKELKGIFSESISSKLSDLRGIVTAAEKNIQQYNKGVAVSNSNLTKSWYDRYSALQNSRLKAHDRPAGLPHLNPMLQEMEPILESKKRAEQSLDYNIVNAADSLAAHVRQNGFVKIKDELGAVVQGIKRRKTLDDLTVHGHGLGTIDVQWLLERVDLIYPSTLSRISGGAREDTRKCVEDLIVSARQFTTSLSQLVMDRIAVEECQAIVASAEESLDSDLENYFKSVQVYRAGVFAIGTKLAIAKLGIGEELAKRETEFTEEDKEVLVLKARAALFPSVAETLASVTTKMREFGDRLRPLDALLKSIRVEAPPNLIDQMSGLAALAAEALKLELANELQRETERLIDQAQTKLASILATTIESYENSIAIATRRRLSMYGITAAICAAIGFAAAFGYNSLRKPVGQSLFEVLLWGVVASLIANGIGLGIVRFRDNFPETKRKITEKYLVQLKSQVQAAMDSLVSSHAFSCLDKAALAPRIKKTYTSIMLQVSSDGWQSENERQFSTLRDLYSQLSVIRLEYLSVIDELVQSFGTFFDDSEKNLTILGHISEEVKDKAIQPSFRLLEETSGSLRQVLDEIQRVEFS